MTKTDNGYTLPKAERLSYQKRIDALFASRESFIAYPLRVVFLVHEADEAPPVSMLVSVSKKRFKRAVKRNRVKRLVREAYRLNKYPFWEIARQNGKKIDIAFLYLKSELPDFSEIEKAMYKAISVLAEKVNTPQPDENPE